MKHRLGALCELPGSPHLYSVRKMSHRETYISNKQQSHSFGSGKPNSNHRVDLWPCCVHGGRTLLAQCTQRTSNVSMSRVKRLLDALGKFQGELLACGFIYRNLCFGVLQWLTKLENRRAEIGWWLLLCLGGVLFLNWIGQFYHSEWRRGWWKPSPTLQKDLTWW